MEQITLQVQGMSCGHCIDSIEGSVEELTGVTSVKVHLGEGKVDVAFDSSKTSLENIKNTIEEQGYDIAG